MPDVAERHAAGGVDLVDPPVIVGPAGQAVDHLGRLRPVPSKFGRRPAGPGDGLAVGAEVDVVRGGDGAGGPGEREPAGIGVGVLVVVGGRGLDRLAVRVGPVDLEAVEDHLAIRPVGRRDRHDDRRLARRELDERAGGVRVVMDLHRRPQAP